MRPKNVIIIIIIIIIIITQILFVLSSSPSLPPTQSVAQGAGCYYHVFSFCLFMSSLCF